MKKIIFILTLSLGLSIITKAQGYQITAELKGYSSGIAYLAYHMGKNLNAADSAAVSSTGVVVFKGSKTLPGGIYAIVFPGKRYTADFFIDGGQTIQIVADSSNLVNMTVTGSKENDLFVEYQRYVAVKGKYLQEERQAYNSSTTKADSVLHEANFSKSNKELNDYRNDIITKQPESMMAALLNAMKEPPPPAKKAITRQDSLDNYYEYRKHYWDGVTFMDERIIRTPFFLPKLERYYREVMPQQSDSLIADIDYKLLLARNEPEMEKFLLNWYTDEYINPKYMGLDAVFVHLFEKYHSKGVSTWLNEKQQETITRRAYMQMANLIGERAHNLEMVDTLGRSAPLYNIQAPFTVVIFWDPTCGHCKEELPRVDSIYKASWKAKGVKLYAVLSEVKEFENWKKYIREHNIGGWSHVYQTKEMEAQITSSQKPGYKQLYDVIMTPTIYLLDKDKRIIGKKLTLTQIDDLLNVKINADKNQSKK